MRAFFRTPAISWFSEHVEVSKMLGALRHHADGLSRVCKGNEIKQGRVNVNTSKAFEALMDDLGGHEDASAWDQTGPKSSLRELLLSSAIGVEI